MKFSLLATSFCFAAIVACQAAGPEPGMNIPLGTQRLEHQWELGNHRETLVLDLKRSARIWSADQRTWLAISFHHPQLAAILHESLKSNSTSGYTAIARAGNTEARLHRVTGISLSLDRNRSVRLRAMADIQLHSGRTIRSAQNRAVAAEFTTEVSEGSLTLTPKSFAIAGVGADINRIITHGLDTAIVALPNCLTRQDLLLEDLRFAEGDNRLTITVSLTGSFMSMILTCLRET